MIPEKVRNKIFKSLNQIEKDENVCVFYACESGSRAWGFQSFDSDYDVRFLYVHPTDWYLSIDENRDIIEKPIDDELDICGWDIKKALKLFRKSNPPLLEWLRSPIVYSEKHNVAQKMRRLLPEVYSPISCLYHYLHMAQGNYKEYLKGEEVWTKKYFYIIRPVLACLWIERDLGPVPMEFEELKNRIVDSDDLRREIDNLLIRKRNGEELSWGPQIPVINDFIESEITRLDSKKFRYKKAKVNTEKLDEFFRESLFEIWSGVK